jgi:hypothetical protein
MPLDWAMTQNNLGSALRVLGQRKQGVTLICEVLKSHIAAWEVFTNGSPYDTSGAATEA